jgi:hypothetical protein
MFIVCSLQCVRPIISRIKHFEHSTMTKQTFLDKSDGLIFLWPTPSITPTPLVRSVTVSHSFFLTHFLSLFLILLVYLNGYRLYALSYILYTIQDVSPCLSVIFYLIMFMKLYNIKKNDTLLKIYIFF